MLDTAGVLGSVIAKTGLRGDGDRIDFAAGPLVDRTEGHDTERRDKPMIPMITALVSSRGADRV
jgi:hypothetical protein